MFQRILQFIQGWLNKMLSTQNVKQALGVDVAVTPLMAEALQLWSLLYTNQAPWLSKDVKSLQLPAAIAGELARAVTIEMKAEVTGSARAEFLNEQIEYILPKLRQMVEYGNAKGGLVFKPYVKDDEICVEFIQADMFYPVSFDANGNMTAVVFSDQRKIGQWYYTRLEYHTMIGNGCQIRNAAFRSSDTSSLGQSVPLSEVSDWADIEPEATITNIDAPLYGYFRYPQANNIDPTSPLGVSCYARAVGLIEDADKLYSNLVWEFESGKRALFVDALAIDKDDQGNLVNPLGRLYRTLKSGGQIGKSEELFEEWSPEFREAAIKAGINDILRQIEFTCGISYGVLSDPQVVAMTATEIKTTQQRFYATVSDTQKALETALDQLLYAMDTWATLANLAPKGTYTTDYEFDDSIIVDDAIQQATNKSAVDMGAMSKLEWRIRTYGETEEVAKKKIADASAERTKEAADQLLARVNAVRLPGVPGQAVSQ